MHKARGICTHVHRHVVYTPTHSCNVCARKQGVGYPNIGTHEMHPCVHRDVHTYTHVYTQMYTHTHTHVHMYTQMYARTHVYIHTGVLRYTQRLYTYTYRCTHIHTHIHKCTYTHTPLINANTSDVTGHMGKQETASS